MNIKLSNKDRTDYISNHGDKRTSLKYAYLPKICGNFMVWFSYYYCIEEYDSYYGWCIKRLYSLDDYVDFLNNYKNCHKLLKKQNYFNINHNDSLVELVCPRYANTENYTILCDLAVKLESDLPGINESIKSWFDLQCQDKLEKIDYWQVFVIYFNDIPIGITGLYKLNGEAWLGWTGLLNEYRNKGILSAILPILFDYLKNKLSFNILNVFTYSDGRRNSFYERNGFTYSMTVGEYLKKSTTTAPDEFGDNISDLIFTKKL